MHVRFAAQFLVNYLSIAVSTKLQVYKLSFSRKLATRNGRTTGTTLDHKYAFLTAGHIVAVYRGIVAMRVIYNSVVCRGRIPG